jgi:DNA-directed RNA polymerase specialized sigma24 family protein
MTSLDATSSEHEVPMSERAQDGDPNPEQLFARIESREMIERNVGELSLPLFTAFVLCGVEEYTHEEAARRLGITVPAMKARMHRARYKLAESLGPLWFAKTLADFEIDDIAALPPLFCYNS